MPLSIYVHWPFCKSKCPYCDFNSHVRDSVDHARWRQALLRELAYFAAKTPGRKVESIFFGGGTPSLMQADTVAAILNEIAHLWAVAEDVEITLEANPTSAEAASFKAFRSAGVNRASLGVQSLRAEELKFLGRQHSADEALAAVALAREIFPRMSFDLIYARPGQTVRAWEQELTQALSYADGHMSLYQLTIEENTAFHHAYHSGKFTLPEEDEAVDLYSLTQDIMQAHGLPAYEISNHARPGNESRHNLTYWRGGEYIGIGPGAHGRYRTQDAWVATETLKSPERWLEQVGQKGHGLTVENALSQRERLEEILMMGLRLTGGIHYHEWQARTGFMLRGAVSLSAVQALTQQGHIIADEAHIRATPSGQLLLNAVTRELLATG